MFDMAFSVCIILALLLYADGRLQSNMASVIQTSFGNGDRLQQKKNMSFKPNFDFGGATIDVGTTAGEPGILGFGGAFTEASAVVYNGLRSDLQREIIDRYYGSHGIGYTIGRVPINSCDFSASSYSFDDVAGDFDLNHFDGNVSHDVGGIIHMLHDAIALQSRQTDLRLFASPWSPPAWMKTNNNMDGTWDPCLRPEANGAWASYISKWLSAYKSHGIDFWAITVQNEPEWNDTRYEQCHFSPAQEGDFLGMFLGPVMRAAHPNVSILGFDHNKHHLHMWAEELYSHPTASKYVDGLAFHWYAGDYFQNVSVVRKEHPRAVLLPTEATFTSDRWVSGDNVAQGQWDFGEGYAHDIIGDLNAGASGWTDWNLILDEHGGPNHAGNTCDAAIRANLSAQEIYLHPQYYFIAHFSKYILPDSKRLTINIEHTSSYTGPARPFGTCSEKDGLQATAFSRPDSIISVVVLNCGERAINFKLRHAEQAFEASIPSHSIQTYLFGSPLPLVYV